MLRQHFQNLDPEEQVKRGWDSVWQKDLTPWDRGQPNPALVDALQQKSYIFGTPFKEVDGKKVRKSVLVPGCGRGYDVLLFASYGFNAYGIDISPTAVAGARKLHSDQSKDQQYPLKQIQDGRGEIKFITADFFVNNFLVETHGTPSEDRTFDLIYDYTFLCALPPGFRPAWAARMSQLLSSTGSLICMEYPLGKSPKLGGPPHGLERELYEQLLAKPGNEVKYNGAGIVCEERSGEKAANALVKIEEWKPERTFDSQKGHLRVSVWQHFNP